MKAVSNANHDVAKDVSAVGRKPPVIAHIVYRFDVGGLENGMVNLINHMPEGAYRHVIICLHGYSAEFLKRLRRPDIEIFSLYKALGKDPRAYLRLWRLLRALKPDVVHTRNLGTIDCLPIAAAAGVPARIHGEHGWDVQDIDGTNRKYRWLRRATIPFTHRYVTVSRELAAWLSATIRIPGEKIVHIYNGVDANRFKPADSRNASGAFVIGSVGRFAEVKDPLNLVEAFILLMQRRPEFEGKVRLVMLGDGPLRPAAVSRLRQSGFDRYADLPGAQDDVADRLRELDVFVLPSRNEGISNTVLEAMATGLPVVATRAGGTPELVSEGVTGSLVPPQDPSALAGALIRYLDAPETARAHGSAGRDRVEEQFSLQAMFDRYMETYEAVLPRAARGMN